MLAYRMTQRSKAKEATVVLLHAFPFSSSMWHGDRRELSRAANIITPDLPGFGASSKQEIPSIAGMAREVSELLDHLKIEEPVVIGGISMGGYAALEFYRQFPDRVRGLMLFSTRADADTDAVRQARYQLINDIEKNGIEPFVSKGYEKMLGETSLVSRPDTVEFVKAMMMTNKVDGICAGLRAMAERADSTELLSKISCPCLVVSGEEDAVIEPSISERMYEAIPGAEFYVVPKAGHILNLERPEIFHVLAENFLEKIAPASIGAGYKAA